MSNCICGNDLEYDLCCGKFLDKKEVASTPLELMRSRYCAFVQKNAKYLNKTSTKNIQDFDALSMDDINWLSLKINSFDDKSVSFSAFYKIGEDIEVMKELSFFVQEEGRLKYDSGKILTPKIDRNELCPCGSGKKYKKCCSK